MPALQLVQGITLTQARVSSVANNEQVCLIRVDAGVQIGSGHVMRCLALAQGWQDAGGQVFFGMAIDAPIIEARLRSEGIRVIRLPVQPGSAEDAFQTAGVARKIGAQWVVVDGYHFGPAYQQSLKDAGLWLLYIDDNGRARHYYADIVLNQNLHAHEDLYRNTEPYTRLLLGTRYVLLRREFLKWRGWKRKISNKAEKVLVTLGGGDPDNVTLKVVKTLQRVPISGWEVVVIVGGNNLHRDELRSAMSFSKNRIRLESNVTNMPGLMAWADLAISAGGSTCWELSFMGLPSLVLVLADNQRQIAEKLAKLGAAVNLGWYDVSSIRMIQEVTQLRENAKMRKEMARRGRQLVDGEGCARVLMRLGGQVLRLRQVREEDCRLLWEWRNDPTVRTSSFATEPIAWKEHVLWFKSMLNQPNFLLWIAVDDQDQPVGQVRFDIQGELEAEINVSIARNRRGLGLGSLLIELAVKELLRSKTVKVIRAFIKVENKSSIRVFQKAGFSESGMQTVRGNPAICYELIRKNSKHQGFVY